MNCPNCGAQLEGTPKFCYNCGQSTEQEAKGATEAAPSTKPKRKFPKWIILVVVGLVAILLACVVVIEPP